MIPKPSETKPFVCLSSQTRAQRLVLPTEAAPTDGSEVTGPVLRTPVLHHKVNLTHATLPSTPKYIPCNAVQKGNPLLNPIQSLPMLARNGHQEARENLPGLSVHLTTDNYSRELHPCCFHGSGNKIPKFPFDFVPHNPSSVCFMLFLQCSSGPLSFMNNGFRLDEWPCHPSSRSSSGNNRGASVPSASRRRVAWPGTCLLLSWDGYRNAGATEAGARGRDILLSQAASWFVGPVCASLPGGHVPLTSVLHLHPEPIYHHVTRLRSELKDRIK